VLSTRGAVLGVGAGCSAIAGLVYGVEEFVFLAMAVAVLLVVGTVSVWRRQRVCRRAVRVGVRVPVAELPAGQSAVVELTVTRVGSHRRPPVLVEDPALHWSVSHPGLGDTGIVGSRRPPSAPGPRSAAPSGWWSERPGGRDERRRRARDRHAVSWARRLPDAGPDETATLMIPVPTRTRGLVRLADVGLWCEDPFRLVSRRVVVAPPAHVLVYPDPAPVAPHTRASGAHPGGRERSTTVPAYGALSGNELSGLRPYAPGDRLTRLHWPSVARTGELVVRDFVEPEAGSLSLLVDVRPTAHRGGSIETTIARAAGLGLGALRQGLTVELCTSAGDRVVIAPNPAGRQTLLRVLALLGPAKASPAVTRRWGARTGGEAVWATASVLGSEVVLVTTAAGAAEPTLPEVLRRQAETVLVP
jgi:uncharacterized protein (DUF58 family)